MPSTLNRMAAQREDSEFMRKQAAARVMPLEDLEAAVEAGEYTEGKMQLGPLHGLKRRTLDPNVPLDEQ